MSHHYRHFCTPGVPQPITGSGRYLEFVLDMKKTQVRFLPIPHSDSEFLNVFCILIGGPVKTLQSHYSLVVVEIRLKFVLRHFVGISGNQLL